MADAKRARAAQEDEELLSALETCRALLSRRLAPAVASAFGPTPVPDEWAANLDRVLFASSTIQTRVAELGAQISRDLRAACAEFKPGQEVVVVGLLNGAVCFLNDVIRQLSVPYVVDFMQVSSYKGTTSKGSVELRKDMSISPEGKHILIVEDIIDTGTTLHWLRSYLKSKSCASVRVACLLDKKEGRQKQHSDVLVEYVGFTCPNEFVVGYGLDFNQSYRGLPFIAVLKEGAYKHS